MTAQIPFNPVLTTNAAGSFGIDWSGFIQGTAMADPATRYQLAGGVLASTEILPMWGGVAISELTPTGVYSSTNPLHDLGTSVSRALLYSATAGTAGSITGFSVFDQNYAAINSPQSPVPLSASYQLVNLYRLGSNARIALGMNSALTLNGNIITQQLSWDFFNQQLTTFQAAYNANVLTATTWASTGGGQATFTTTSAHGVGVGQYVTITGAVPAGYNGTWLTVTGTTGSTLVVAMPTNPGSITTEGTLSAGGGALPIKVLDYNVGNSMTVSYNSTTGVATWNRTGSCALVQI